MVEINTIAYRRLIPKKMRSKQKNLDMRGIVDVGCVRNAGTTAKVNQIYHETSGRQASQRGIIGIRSRWRTERVTRGLRQGRVEMGLDSGKIHVDRSELDVLVIGEGVLGRPWLEVAVDPVSGLIRYWKIEAGVEPYDQGS